MRLHFRLDSALPHAQIRALQRKAEDTKPLLRRWAGYLRAKAKERAKEASSPPLAASTIKKYLQAKGPLITRSGTVRQAQARRILQALKARKDQHSVAELKRLVDLAPNVSAGRPGARERAAAPAGAQFHRSVERLRKQLLARKTKRRKKAKDPGGHHLLGKLITAFKAFVNPRSVAIVNMVKWSDVHNEGGTAGHGARIPARLGLEIDNDDADELAKIVVEHLTKSGR